MNDKGAHKASEVLRSNLVRLRREQKLSLEKLAKTSGVSRAMLNQIGAGRSVPTVDLAERIAIGLKVSIHVLLRFYESG